MKTRIISGLLWAPLLIAFVYVGKIPFMLFLTYFAVVGQKEFYNALNLKEKESNYFMYGITVLLFFIEYLFDDRAVIAFLIVSFLSLFIHFVVRFSTFTIEKVALYLFSIFYISIPFLIIYKIRDMDYGLWLVCIPFIVAFSSDSFAYFTGKFIGKRKLAPILSPNKTIEGSIGGVIGSMLMMYIFINFMATYGLKVELSLRFGLIIIMLSGLSAILSQFGDLCASAIKRQKNVKDYGDLIKGHGGVLDRTDSVIFTTLFWFMVLNLL